MVFNTEDRVCLSLKHQNRRVKVTLEFPVQSDPDAERELVSGLRAIYSEKIRRCCDLRGGALTEGGGAGEDGLPFLSPAAGRKGDGGNV